MIESEQKAFDCIDSMYYPSSSESADPKFTAALNFYGKVLNAATAWMNGGGYDHLGGTGRPFDGDVFKDKAGLVAFGNALKLPSQYEDWFEPWDELIRKYKAGDMSAGTDFLLRVTALEMLRFATESNVAWPSMNIKGLNGSQEMILFMNRKMRAINFANLLTDEIARTMPPSYKNPSDFTHDFLEAMIKIPNSDYYAMFSQADRDASKVTMKELSIDGRGGPPSWVDGPVQYSVENGEWVYRVGGQTLFGKGYINGDLREVDFSSALEVNMKKERTDRQTESFGTDEAAKATVGVK